jgi:hypothetical protein
MASDVNGRTSVEGFDIRGRYLLGLFKRWGGGIPRSWNKLHREVTWFVVFTVNSQEGWHGHGI